MSRPFLLLQTGSAPDRVRRRRGDYPDWFRRAMRLPRAALVVADARTAAPLPDPRGHAGVVVTGSDAMVRSALVKPLTASLNVMVTSEVSPAVRLLKPRWRFRRP